MNESTLVLSEVTPKASAPTKRVRARMKAELDTAKRIDFGAVVEGVAKRKTSQGLSYTGLRKGNTLFASCCAVLKSQLGLDSKLGKLAQSEVASLKAAIETFWQSQAQNVLNYGVVTGASFDKPLVKFDKECRVSEVSFTASIHAKRELCKETRKELGERKLVIGYSLANKIKRQAYMLDNLMKFETSDLQTVAAQIEGLKQALNEVNTKIATLFPEQVAK